jgi:uncharacterized protein YcgI (DUF1989 family)
MLGRYQVSSQDSNRVTIPARRGKAALVKSGQSIAVINTHGHQVVDTWVFNARDLGEFMSMEHTRVGLIRLIPRAGDSLLTNHRRPILTILSDTSPGIHDTLMAACDRFRYEQLGCIEYHDNCTDNLHAALSEIGLEVTQTPSPLNLFMNIPWTPEGSLRFEKPVGRAGDAITFRADIDLVIVFSACPQDLVAINGPGPTEAHFEIF